jgi:hypothetical protein
MPRDLPLGNGSLLVAFDKDYQIRDLAGSQNLVVRNCSTLRPGSVFYSGCRANPWAGEVIL